MNARNPKLLPPGARRLNRLAPGFTSRANLLTDLAIIAGCVVLSGGLPGGLTGPALKPMLWIITAMASTWIVSSAALRHYASFAYDRSLLDEVAMIGAQAAAALTTAILLEAVAPAGTPFPSLPRVLVLLV